MDDRSKESVCKVCGDKASGKHYGVASCDGCRGFFKRSIRRNLDYVCKENGRCVVDVTRRNQCQACRFSKCLKVNMKKDAVQHERSPRNCGAPSIAAIAPLVYAPHYLQTFPYLPPPHPGLPLLSCYYRSDTSCNENEVTSSQEVMLQSNKSVKSITSRSLLNSNDIYLTSRRLLQLAIDCADVIPSFKQLPAGDRDTLLEDSWKALFILTMAQWSIPIEHERLLSGVGTNESSTLRTLSKDLSSTAAALAKLTHFHVDHTEYACLKALVLFSPESVKKHEIEMLQEQTHLMLCEYSGPRATKLLLILVTISRIAVSSVSQLFFRARQNASLIELLSPV